MFSSVFPSRVVVAALSTSMLVSAGTAMAQPVRSFSVPAGPATAAVPQFARQAGLQILMSADAARGVRTSAVNGALEPRRGLERLLTGSDLRIASWRGDVVTLTREAPRPEPEEAQDTRNVGSEEILVVGVTSPFRTKDNATTIVETAVFDDVETMTADGSIAALLAQLPGISTEEDADQPRYVTIRGISADLNHTTIDGITTATVGENGSGTRRTNLQLIPSDLSTRTDLFKTFTAEQDAGAIGGAINIVTRSAFDKGQKGLFVDTYGIYSTYGPEGGSNAGGKSRDHLGFGVKANYGTRFGPDDAFGFVVSGRYEDRVRNASKRWQDNKLFFTEDGTNIPRPDAELGWNGLVAPGNHGYGSYTNLLEAYGGSAKLEYKAPDNSVYGSIVAYDYVRQEDQTMNSNYVDTARWIDDQTADGGRQRVTNLVENWRHNQYRRENRGILTSAAFNFDNDSQLSIRSGISEESFVDWEPYLGARANPVNQYLTYSAHDLPTLISLDDPSIMQNSTYNHVTQRQHWTDAKQRVFNARADYSYNVGRGAEGLGFVTGVEWRRLNMDKDVERIDYRASGRINDHLFDPGYAPAGAPHSFAWFDYHRFREERWDQTPVNETASRHNSGAADFRYREDTTAAYLSVHYNLPTTTIVAGMRYDHVSFTAHTPRISAGVLTGEIMRNKGGYNNLLPSLAVVQRFGENTNLRLSYSRTLGRPTPGNIATAESISCGDNEEGGAACTITRGNPDLRPRKATNVDATVEHYFDGANGMLLLGYFHKDIKDDIFTLRTETLIDGEPYLIRQPLNAARSAIDGIEFAYVQRNIPVIGTHTVDLSFNAARMMGEMTYVSDDLTRDIDRMLSQPDWIGNVSATYRIPELGAGVRLNANYRDIFLSSIGANPWLDRQNDQLLTVNFAAWHDVTDNLLFKYEWNNILDQQPRFLMGENAQWTRQIDEYGTGIYFHAILQF